MASRKQRILAGSAPLTFLAMPVGGALAVAMAVLPAAVPFSALTATSSGLPARSLPGSNMLDLREPRARERRESDCRRAGNHPTWSLRRARAGTQKRGVLGGATAVQVHVLFACFPTAYHMAWLHM